MTKKYKKIISYFRKCADAEDSKAFRIPKDKNSIFNVTPYKSEIKKILFGDEPFFTISGQQEFTKFFEHWKINKKNNHIFLAIDIIKKREKTGISLLPLYMVEVFIEEMEKIHGQEGDSSADIFRISIADNEPWFNRSLLDSTLTVDDQFLLLDEIREEPDWISKRNHFLSYLDKKHSHNKIKNPLLFISNLQVVDQSRVSGELDWIERRYLEKIPDTALSLIFDRESNSSPQYEKARYLEIFPMDKIQRDVVQFALNNPFTSITGPPGTGKSQVVLNLLANIYINHKTVLFASKNNKAVNTVVEKLEKVQNGFCPFVRLGNEKEKKKGLQKILSGLSRGVPAKREILYEELSEHSESINFLYEKLENARKNFDLYCSSVKTL